MRRALGWLRDGMANVLLCALLIAQAVFFIAMWAIVIGLIVAALFGVYHLVVWAA